MAVPWTAVRLPNVRPARKLFDTGMVPDATVNQYAVTQDGQKFLVLEPRKAIWNPTLSFLTGLRC